MSDPMLDIVSEVMDEVASAAAQHGDQLERPWRVLPRAQYGVIGQEMAQREVEERGEAEMLSWADILIEEVAEAVDEDDPILARAELIQVAAMAMAAINAIDHRLINVTRLPLGRGPGR